MTATKTTTKKKSLSSEDLAPPFLEHLVFTECSSKLSLDSKGLPLHVDLSNAAMTISLVNKYQSINSDDGAEPRAVINVRLSAQASKEKSAEHFYKGEVAAIGFFVCDSRMTQKDIEVEIAKKNSYFDAATNIVHAIVARQLERLIELTGLPSPGIPMSQDHPSVKIHQLKKDKA